MKPIDSTEPSELVAATEYLTSQRPGFRMRCRVPIKGRERWVSAWWFFPGYVAVTLPGAWGPLLAQSLPGFPTVLSDEEYEHGEDWPRACDMTLDERRVVLGAAAEALQGRNRVFRDRGQLGYGRGAVSVDVCWQWPGVFTIANRKSGQVIARSLPGKPGEMVSGDRMKGSAA